MHILWDVLHISCVRVCAYDAAVAFGGRSFLTKISVISRINDISNIHIWYTYITYVYSKLSYKSCSLNLLDFKRIYLESAWSGDIFSSSASNCCTCITRSDIRMKHIGVSTNSAKIFVMYYIGSRYIDNTEVISRAVHATYSILECHIYHLPLHCIRLDTQIYLKG